MRHFKTAQELRITPLTHKYLKYALRTLTRLNTPKKLNGGTFGFNMTVVNDSTSVAEDRKGFPCGTAGCILGLMQYKAKLDGVEYNEVARLYPDNFAPLYYLYFPDDIAYEKVTHINAAKTVTRFLETGKIKFNKR